MTTPPATRPCQPNSRCVARNAGATGFQSRFAPAKPDENIPAEIGDFRIIRKVGYGAMGVVYEAEQRSLRRRVALKVLPFGALSDERAVKRFEHEARAAAKLDHPHVVKVFDFGQDQGTHYLAMQFVDGRPMSETIHERRTSGTKPPPAPAVRNDATTVTNALADSVVVTAPTAAVSTKRPRGDTDYFKKVARWVRDAAAGLEHAREKGVVHRDIKPGNLLVNENGQVLVADFGLAKMIDCESGFTATGDILGTLRYMSPEQAAGKKNEVDHRSDIYSLGATLYELLALTPAHRRQRQGRDPAEDRDRGTGRFTEARPPDSSRPGNGRAQVHAQGSVESIFDGTGAGGRSGSVLGRRAGEGETAVAVGARGEVVAEAGGADILGDSNHSGSAVRSVGSKGLRAGAG